MQREAREHAVRQWTTNPCGLEEDYEATERARYEAYPWLKKYLDKVLRYGAKGSRVLEIGPGVGTDLKQFARAGAECSAIDITHEHLKHTRENLLSENLEAWLYIEDATELHFPDGYFDLVFINGVLHHIPEAEQVIAEIERVLKPGGAMYLVVYSWWSWFHLYKLLTWRPWRMSYSSHMATLERGADGVDRKPYIKLYTRGILSRLLDARWHWASRTRTMSPLPDWIGFGGWFHEVVAVKRCWWDCVRQAPLMKPDTSWRKGLEGGDDR